MADVGESKSSSKNGVSNTPSKEFGHLRGGPPSLDYYVKKMIWADTSMEDFLMRIWPKARHDFLIFEIGEVSRVQVPKTFRKDRIVVQHKVAILDFGGAYDELTKELFGVIGCYDVLVDVDVSRVDTHLIDTEIQKKISKNCKMYNQKDVSELRITLREICGVAEKLTVNGYNIWSMNCRTFAGSIYNALINRNLKVMDDRENMFIREVLDKYFNGYRSARSMSRASISTSQNLMLLTTSPVNWVSLAQIIYNIQSFTMEVTKLRRI